MSAVQSLPNGYIRYFYILGTKQGDEFINHNRKSKTLVRDPLRSKKFDTKEKALEYYKEVEYNYSVELIAHHVRVVVELVT